MKAAALIFCFIFICTICHADEIADFVSGKPQDPPLDVLKIFNDAPRELVQNNAGTLYHILAYKENYIDRLIEMSVDDSTPEARNLKDSALGVLWAIAGHEHKMLTFQKLRTLIEKVEANMENDLRSVDVYRLGTFYGLMANSGLPEALEFLKERASFEYWQGKKMPRKTTLPMPPGSDVFDKPGNAQEQALGAIAYYPAPDAEAFLRKCQRDPRYKNDEILERAIETSLTRLPEIRSQHALLEEAWAKRAELLKANGEESTPQATASSTAVPVAPVKSTQSTMPDSGKTWLFLIGSVIILASGYILIRRK